MTSNSVMRVCVVGAGAAGLSACRHLAALPAMFLPTVYEQTEVVGGTWVYTDSVGTDENGLPVHSSMYRNLYTNLPKEVMAFPDFPFKPNDQSFLHHSQIREYLENYSDTLDLNRFIQFGTRIKNVKPIKIDEQLTCWKVEHEKVAAVTKETEESYFDAVIICNGHYSVPNFPKLDGLDKFNGLQIHSHDYRSPEPFEGLRVVVLGAAASGVDISLEICLKAKTVFLSHNGPKIPSTLPENLVQVSGVVSLSLPSTFVLNDSTSVEADAVIFCTGYTFDFPFLDPECHVTVVTNQVTPLYKHIIHTEYPTLGFIGIPFQVCPFPQFDLQARLFVKILSGEVKLPTREEMNADTEEEKKRKKENGIADRHFHKMGNLQWAYNRELATMAKVESVPESVELLYNDVHKRRMTHLTSYKKDRFKLEGDAYVFDN